MPTETQAELEVAQFLAGGPSPEDIIAFHASPAVAERMYGLIDLDRVGQMSEAEKGELESYLYIEHLMRLVKAEAYRKLGQRAS
jgi:hypothetical protein